MYGFLFKNKTFSRLFPRIWCGQVPMSTYVPAPLKCNYINGTTYQCAATYFFFQSHNYGLVDSLHNIQHSLIYPMVSILQFYNQLDNYKSYPPRQHLHNQFIKNQCKKSVNYGPKGVGRCSKSCHFRLSLVCQ